MNRLKPITVMLSAVLTALLAVCPAAAADGRPNIVVILVDDMGYSDLGCYGGEVQTPHLDALAEGGLRFTQFYNTGRCCPTRASLLTGLHPHQAGVGWMTESPGNPGSADFGQDSYRGVLSPDTPTAAEALGDAGYRTMMAGKWHLGMNDRSSWPTARGFDRFYGLLAGATNFFQPLAERGRGITLDDEAVDTPGDYYFTDAITDYAIRFLDEAERIDDDQPFFLYIAHTAPHWPIQAPKEDVDKYRQRYTDGWEPIRAERYARMKRMGLVEAGWPLTPLDGPKWDTLEPAKQAEMALRMAIYAAMIDRMDQNVGRVLGALKRLGERDNTLIVFLNDNGACAEGGPLGGGPADQLETKRGYFLTYGRMWANASNTPYREYKHWVHEGGIATPCIVNWPAGIPEADRGALRDQPSYLPDLMPTMLDLAQAEGRPAAEGVSLVPAIVRNAPAPERAMYWEHEGNAAVRLGDWKLVRRHAGGAEWELYNLAEDRTEMNNLVDAQPQRAAELIGLWDNWADRVGVMAWEGPKKMRERAQRAE